MQAMTRLPIFILLMASACCFGQQTIQCSSNGETWTETGSYCHADPKLRSADPLKCGKYEQFEPAHYGDSCEHIEMSPPGTMCAGIAMQISARCVPIMHPVTEKDFQLQLEINESLRRELRDLRLALAANNERLKELESKGKR